jgi:AP-3 complex subunit delta-1
VQLFTFIRADLSSFRPEDSNVGFLVNDTSQHPAYPKSLLLINPLFSNYELNSVSIAAQDSIPFPEFLDLDVWIIPPPKELSMDDAAAANDTEEGERPLTKKKVKSKGKGKGKERDSKVASIKSHGSQPDHISSPGPSETEEEKLEREKASKSVQSSSRRSDSSTPKQSATPSKDGASST